MRRLTLVLITTLPLMILTMGHCQQKPAAAVLPRVTDIAESMAVVELFTSEGCSSCPPADALVATLVKQQPNVLVLAYHVDYWDRLGWKDPFSQAAFSQRQRNYGQQFALQSVYTPQIVVNGSTEFVGSNQQKLQSALADKNKLQPLEILAKRAGNDVAVSWTTDASKTAQICLAFVQPQATTKVLRGENGGRQLTHVNLVRLFNTFAAKPNGEVTITLPADVQNIPLQLIAFIQQKNGQITAAGTVEW